MTKLMVFISVAVLVLLAACGGGSDEGVDATVGKEVGEVVKEELAEGEVIREVKVGTSASFSPVALPPVPAFGFATSPTSAPLVARLAAADLSSQASSLETTLRKVISMASVSIEVEVVEAAVTEVRVVAEGLGGFIEQLSSSGEPERQQAYVTVRVPQADFFKALERIEALGKVQNRQVGSEDVSEQFIDLEARLKSSLREEQSLLSLLEKTQTVGEILSIERELSRVRSEVERLQGRLNFLERRVDLATISVNLFPPMEDVIKPPFALLTIQVSDVTGSLEDVKALTTSLEGVLDRVSLTIRDGKERADLSLRVFTPEFDQALASIESQGKIQSKELQETNDPMLGKTDRAEDPDARIDVSFVEEPDSSNTVLIVSIAAPIGGVAFAALLGFLFYLTFRAGRRRARKF